MGVVRTRLLTVAALLGLLGVLTACGGEEPIVDDGAQGVPLAGQRAALDANGVEIVSATAPASAAGADVTAALEAQQLTSGEITAPEDLGPFGGLVTARGDVEQFVVLVFDGPASAAVYAARGRDDTAEADVYLAGNVVAVAFDHSALVRRAVRDLAGA